MPLVSLTVKIFGQQVHTRFEKIQDFFAQISARAQENFTGVRVVRAYAQENAEIAAFNRLCSSANSFSRPMNAEAAGRETVRLALRTSDI